MLLPHELTDTLRPQELISGFQKNHLSFKKLPFKLIVATAWVANLNVDLFITGYEKGQ